MLRRICIVMVAIAGLTVCNLARSQDATTNAPPSAGEGDEVTQLRAENAVLKKEVADAARTITTLQAALAQAGISHQTVTTSDNPANSGAATNAAPAGPLRALPLDATNANVTPVPPGTPGAPAADAGPSRTYTVVKGDSLWKIAHKMYPGDTKNGVDKIQEANKDALGTKPLKIGQVLIIPQ